MAAKSCSFLWKCGRRDSHQNDTQHNDIDHNNTKCNTCHETLRKTTIIVAMLSGAF